MMRRILDGRNRWRAAKEAGAKVATETYDGDDPLAFVISMNLRRRHLDESQRSMVAKRLATLTVGRPKIGQMAQIPTQAEGCGAAQRRTTLGRARGRRAEDWGCRF